MKNFKRITAAFLAAGIAAGCVTLPAADVFSVKASAASDVAINEKNFPDKAFREIIKTDFDPNKDGKLTPEEISSTTFLFAGGEDVKSLKGIEYFTEIETFICGETSVTEIDLSKNTKLIYVECGSNKKLKKLDLRKNKELQTLVCYNNAFTELDVSGNKKLEVLKCHRNKLTKLDIKNNTKLKTLTCYENKLTELDVSKNTALNEIVCDSNKLTELNVKKCKELTILTCEGNKIAKLDVSKNTKLYMLMCKNNKIKKLDVRNNPELDKTYFSCDSKVVIYGKKGSDAEEYAKDHGNKFVAV